MLRATFDSLGEAVFQVQSEWREIVDYNTYAEKLFGWPREKMVGQSTRMLQVNGESHKTFGKLSEKVLEGNIFYRAEYTMKRRGEDTLLSDHTVTLVRTENRETPIADSAMEAVSSGFLLKNTGLDKLLSAMETVMQGNSYFSSKAAHSLVQGMLEDENHATEELTECETEILLLICREMTNPEIDVHLFLSVRTIDAHRRNILQKSGARNTAGLVAYAHRHGLSGS